jgi:chromate reductase
MRIVGLSGSLRGASYNTRVLRAAAALDDAIEPLPAALLKAIPPFDVDDEPAPPAAVERLRRELRGADGLLIVTPEYNRSLPGQLKNALDWVSRPIATNPLRGKPVAVTGASTGIFGTVWAQADLRRVLEELGARPVERELLIPQAPDALTEDGRLADPEVEAELLALLAALRAMMIERRAA